MEEQLEELRYPFTSAAEFFSSYWLDPAALHLDFAWLAALVLILRVLIGPATVGQKLVALYFGLTMFNNFAFQVLPGNSLGDFFGVACSLYLMILVATGGATRLRPSPVGFGLCAAAIVMGLHAAAIGAFYSELNAETAGFLRFAVIAKVFVLGLGACLFDQVFSRAEELDWLIRKVVGFAIVGLIVYIIQAGLLLTGTVPFGTYFDAGYIGFPSFGSVSIERGHFGKFMTPLFPLFVYMVIRHNRVKTFLGFVAVTLVNFSASSLTFFAGYIAVSLVMFRRKFMRVRYMVGVAALAVAAGVFVAYTWTLWAAVVDKIYQFAVKGGSGGGRGVGTFVSYLANYPLGTSYGGSSLRIAPGLGELNTGIFAFFAQLSFLGAILIGGFALLLVQGLRCAYRIGDAEIRKVLVAGIVLMPLIFAADILWFVPTIWLPLMLAYRFAAVLPAQSLVTSSVRVPTGAGSAPSPLS